MDAAPNLRLLDPEPDSDDAPKRHVVRRGKKPDAARILELVEQARRTRQMHESIWVRNKLFVRGDQWDDMFDPVTGVPQRQPVPDWKKFTTVNVTYNHRRVLVSKRVAVDHVPLVVPASSEESDRAKARACEALLSWVLRENDYERERCYNATEAVETGDSWWRLDWDAKAGCELALDPQARLAVQESGVPADELDDLWTGMCRLRSVSPLEIFVSPGVLRLKDARWLCHVQWMAIDEAKERWGQDVVPEPGDDVSRILRPRTPLDPDQRRQAEDFLTVTECWHRPNKDHPRGFWAVVANDKVLDWDDHLEPWGIPFVHCPFDPDPDQFSGTTPITHVCQIQRELNRLVAAMLDGASHSMFPPIMAPNGSNMQMPTGQPGEMLGYNESAGRPWILDTRPVDAQVFQIVALLNAAINMVSGVSEATLGEVGSSTSGRAIAFAAEKDEVKLAAAHKVYKAAARELFMLILRMTQHYGRGRVFSPVLGENAAPDLADFDLSELSFKDVEIWVDESLPQDPAAKRSQALMFLQAGAITKEQFEKMLDFGAEAGRTAMDPVKQRAHAENRMLYEQDVPVMVHEDHAKHIECHLDEMNQSRWYGAPQDVKIRFLQHLQQHGMMMQGIPSPTVAGGAGNSTGTPGAPGALQQPQAGAVPLQQGELEQAQFVNPTR